MEAVSPPCESGDALSMACLLPSPDSAGRKGRSWLFDSPAHHMMGSFCARPTGEHACAKAWAPWNTPPHLLPPIQPSLIPEAAPTWQFHSPLVPASASEPGPWDLLVNISGVIHFLQQGFVGEEPQPLIFTTPVVKHVICDHDSAPHEKSSEGRVQEPGSMWTLPWTSHIPSLSRICKMRLPGFHDKLFVRELVTAAGPSPCAH